MSNGHRAISLAAVLCLAACGDDSHAPPAATPDSAPAAEPDAAPLAITCDEGTLADTLGLLPAVSSATETACGDYVVEPARCFAITMDQPVDHAEPEGPSFPQHLFLVHRGCDRPTLVADWGYSNDVFFDIELSMLYGTNDLWIEHRFQGASVPAASDWNWSALTIENGARDIHQVIDSFKELYQGRWVSTGASKGGITATYHSYFFPDDLDGAIPYVAPASRARIDPAYQDFLDDNLPACGDRVRDVQVAALTTRRAMMLDRLTPYTGPGGEAEGLEMLTDGLDWGFWQAWGATYCNQVPRETATDGRFWKFYLDFSYLAFAAPATGDEEKSLGALYYEWLTEQGFALQVNSRVAPLLEEPASKQTMEDLFRERFPTVELPAYDGSVTAAVRDWMRDEAEDVLLVYGQYDPWSGGMMDAPAQASSARFTVPAATHGGAQLSALGEEDQAAALAIATRFFGTEPDLEQLPSARRAGAAHRVLLQQKEMRALATPLRLRLRVH